MSEPFNRNELLVKLDKLPSIARVTFAAAVASRLLPIYFVAWRREDNGTGVTLQSALSYVWTQVLEDTKSSPAQTQHLRQQLETLICGIAEKTRLEQYAIDAASGVAYAVRALEVGNVDEPLWAVQTIWEAIGRYVISANDIQLTGPALASVINNDALMQAEFTRQFRDLEELKSWESENTIAKIKSRAESEPALPTHSIVWSKIADS
jgi:uncharacterized protein YjaG (DUF416 family)